MQTCSIAAIPGDGIGKKVVPPAMKVLDRVAARHSVKLDWTEFDWSCERYLADRRITFRFGDC